MWFFFRASPEKRTTFPPSRERSEREMQKTLLGYAHPSSINWHKDNLLFIVLPIIKMVL
ncbi:MAG: hypothetical protein U5L45_09755 [Saprospiraceae bacterium]|nr:hypothetical protein [Saprospiraceae bacterium]